MFCRGFSVEFLARQASKTPNVPSNKAPVVKLQLSSAQRHPAPGYRMYGSGRLSYVGNHGFNWSSSIPEGSVTARHLLFDYNVLYINHGYYRAFGFQLRCLQEEGTHRVSYWSGGREKL